MFYLVIRTYFAGPELNFEMVRSCPVCGHVGDNLQAHMSTVHSKEEIVSALMRSQDSPALSQTGPSSSSAPEQNNTSTSPPSTASSIATTTVTPSSSSSESKQTGGPTTSFGLPGVLGYVDNSTSLQFLAVAQAGHRSNVNPIFLQQASSIQACSLQQTALIQAGTSSDGALSSGSASSTISSTPSQSTSSSSAGTIQIRRTLNNVNIVGTNLTPAQPSPGSSSSSGGGSSVVIPPVNMVGGHLGLVGGGLMPLNMMSGMTSTPLLLPQVNGPTLLVNVPNYMAAYQGVPGMIMPGLIGPQIATIGSVSSLPQVVLPSAPVTTTSPASQPAVVSTAQSSITTSIPATGATSVLTVDTRQETEDTEMAVDISDSEEEVEEVTVLETNTETEVSPEILTLPESEEPSEYSTISLAALVSPPNSRQRHQSVISHAATSKNRNSNQISAIISPRSVSSSVQDSLLASTASQDTPAPAEGASQSSKSTSITSTATSSTTTSTTSTDSGLLGSEPPALPQLTLNFPNISLMMERPSSPSLTSPPSSVIVSPPSPASFSLAGQQPITVDTVEALQSALACDNDVQLVVSNELLETPEFKALMQNMDNGNTLVSAEHSMESTPAVSPVPRPEEMEEDSQGVDKPTHILEESNPPSPVPGSSRDVSRETTRQGFDTSTESLLSMNQAGSDDDMTLQDLIAVETIDESQMAEDDIHWSSQLSFDSFNYISAVISQGTRLEEPKTHPAQAGSKAKKSKNMRPATVTSEEVKEYVEEMKDMKQEPALWVEDEMIEDCESEVMDIKPPTLKQEHSVATQNPLGAQNKHWKCGQCKVVYETGPELLEHLDTIKRAKIKCIPCHLVFEDRKDLITHRRKEHPAELLKLKFDPDKDVIEEADVLDEKVYLPNALGEYVCDTCDRAFTEKDLLMKHLTCHIEENPHECLECGKKFNKANLLREHRKRHFEEGNFQCNFCQKKFFTPNKLREHIRIHTGEAPLKCNICGKGFKRHSNLSEHKKIHEPNREVKPQKELFCHCGKVFKTQRDLDWHKEGEHDMEPKKCTYCLEVFVHSSSLTRHIRMKHEGNFMPDGKKTNLYARCPICSQVFYKTSINKHIR